MNLSRREFLTQTTATAALAASAGSLLGRDAPPAAARSRRPNVILMLADNQGAWTMGCYGNREIRTPHLDQFAAEGARFTRMLSCNPVCSPTRASYLTGLLPSQHGILDVVDAEYLNGSKAPGYDALAEFQTLPRILRAEGYTCGLTGKWHLGHTLVPAQGFSTWVTMPTGSTTGFVNAEVVENGKVRREPGHLTDFWASQAVKFIEQNQENPFFLYLPFNGPWGLDPTILEPTHSRHAAYYADKPLLSFPRESMHPWLFDNKAALNNPTAIRNVAAEVTGVDEGVGHVMAALERLGLDDNTLVIYAADQGWMGGQNGIWGMGDHTRPISAFEAQMHVPLLFRHPGHIPAGLERDLVVSTYDLMPTVLNYLGLGGRIPAQPRSPGRDYSAALRGETIRWDNVMYYELEYTRAIRAERWKYVARHPDGPGELYDLQTDPHEHFNLFGQPDLAAIQREMAGRLEAFFTEHANPKYDVWKGGARKPSVVDRMSRTAIA